MAFTMRDDYFEILKQQRDALARAQRRKGQKPMNKMDRWQFQALFAHQSNGTARSYPTKIRSCFIGMAYPPSLNPVAQLRPMTIGELLLETRHSGRVLFVRTFVEANRIVAVQTAVEDENGAVDRLALYNDDPDVPSKELLPNRTVFAIKEPYYKASADGFYTIRVDHPSDLVRLTETDTLVPSALRVHRRGVERSALGWKTMGNKEYGSKEYTVALRSYSRGIEKGKNDGSRLESDLFRNRSIVNFMLRRYERADADAMAAMIAPSDALDPEVMRLNSKSFFRAGRAAYLLSHYEKAKSLFDEALKLVPDDTDVLQELKRTRLRLLETTGSGIDIAAMSGSVSKTNICLDHASFTANVEIKDAGAQGRGIFATKAIKVGELILCEKAFITASPSTADHYMLLNFNTNRGATGPHASLLFHTIQLLRHNPSHALRFLQLFGGGYEPRCQAQEVDNTTVIDTFHVESIIEHNVFGFRPGNAVDGADMEDDKVSEESRSVGIWITASYMNHECVGNAFRTFFGDMMIIHANQDIPTGEQITMPYRSLDATFDQTSKGLERTWGFQCNCLLCSAERKTSRDQRKKREKLLAESARLLAANRHTSSSKPNQSLINRMTQLLASVRNSYDKTIFQAVPLPRAVELGAWLCQAYSMLSNAQKAIDVGVSVLRDAGYGVTKDHLTITRCYPRCYLDLVIVDVAVYISHAYHYLDRMHPAVKFESFAMEVYQIRYGHVGGFAKRYGRLPSSAF